MTDSPESRAATRRRWITLGEIIALAALAISALGLWNSWKKDDSGQPAPQAETKAAIPIAFRGSIESDGKVMTITPVEAGHSLESLTLTVPGKPPVSIGSDGRLVAAEVERLIDAPGKDSKTGSISARFDARYIEAGTLKRGGGRYRISYRWDEGGLFGGDKLRLTGLSHG
jgi:hypothetical protein